MTKEEAWAGKLRQYGSASNADSVVRALTRRYGESVLPDPESVTFEGGDNLFFVAMDGTPSPKEQPASRFKYLVLDEKIVFEFHRISPKFGWSDLKFMAVEKSKLGKRKDTEPETVQQQPVASQPSGAGTEEYGNVLAKITGDKTYAKSLRTGTVGKLIIVALCSKVVRLMQEQDTSPCMIQKENKVMFNTGLIDRFGEPLIAIGDIVKRFTPGWPPIYVTNIVFVTDPMIAMQAGFTTEEANSKLAPVRFYNNASDIVFNPLLPVHDTYHTYEHIFEDNAERIGNFEVTGNELELAERIKSSLKIALKRQYLDCRYIIPMYALRTDKINFMFPIYFSGKYSGTPDAVGLLSRENEAYRLRTLLTCDMALECACVLGYPYNAWLAEEKEADV